MKYLNSIKELAYAKINLWLDVLNKRPSGYHNIKSVMQTVNLSDIVTVKLKEHGVTMTCSDPCLSCGEDNLCIKAAKTFLNESGYNFGVSINLEKKIPIRSGLGGGSADAAAVLRALNNLTGEKYNKESLRNLGARIGADVPFCVTGGTMLAEGIGDELYDFYTIPNSYIVICVSSNRISTADAYRKIDSSNLRNRNKEFTDFVDAMKKGDLNLIGRCLYNRFEDISSDSSVLKDEFLSKGAVGTLMSGSGCSVFGIFDNYLKASSACDSLKENENLSYLCRPVGSITIN